MFAKIVGNIDLIVIIIGMLIPIPFIIIRYKTDTIHTSKQIKAIFLNDTFLLSHKNHAEQIKNIEFPNEPKYIIFGKIKISKFID